MIKKREIKKLFNLSRKFLLKRPNLYNLSNNFLFLQSTHPFNLNKYKYVDSKKISIFFILRYFLEFLKNFFKIIIFFIKIIFYNNYSNIKKKNSNRALIICHLTSISNFKKNSDTQYFGIEKKFVKGKSNFFYLDHIKVSSKQKKNLLNFKKNTFINNDCVEISFFLKILVNIIIEINFLISEVKKNNSSFQKKYYLECAKFLFSLSTIKNIILYKNIEEIILKKKINKILITFEGHPYEFLIYLLAHIYKIKVYAYQTSYITKNHYSMFLKLGNNLNPTKILTNGKIGYDYLKTKFNSKKLILLGSYKYKKKSNIKKTENLNLLVIPSAYEGEAFEFLELCCKFLKKNKHLKIKIIFRLHPQIKKSSFIKQNLNYFKRNTRLKISESSLNHDISNCNFVLYRSSSAVVDALQQGLVPIFYVKGDDLNELDPLWNLKFKLIVKNSNQLTRIFNSKKKLNTRKNLSHIKFADNYYRPINTKELLKL